MTATSAAVLFLTGEGRDHRGRSCADLLAFDDAELERSHDYIQWLLPLPEASRLNIDAPVLDAEAMADLAASAAAKANLERARDRMLAFHRSNGHWLTGHDHNHLRITRIIRCLALVLGKDEARGFHDQIRVLVTAAHDRVNADALR